MTASIDVAVIQRRLIFHYISRMIKGCASDEAQPFDVGIIDQNFPPEPPKELPPVEWVLLELFLGFAVLVTVEYR